MRLRAVILDRDGVINYDSVNYIKSAAEWQPIPGSLKAIARLKKAGLQVFVATNQSGLAHGLYDVADLQAMHDKMQNLLADYQASIDAIHYCPHKSGDGCQCQKPQPGMVNTILHDWQLAPDECVMVGDKPTDIQAAQTAGVTGYGVRSGYTIDNTDPRWQGVKIFADLQGFVDYQLARLGSSS